MPIFSSIVLSTIDCFNVFSFNKVITLTQSRNLVYLYCKDEMYSFVFKIAMDKNRVALEGIIMLTPRFDIAKLLQFIVEADPIKISMTNNKTFFLFEDSYFLP